jgi:hypothetical protein
MPFMQVGVYERGKRRGLKTSFHSLPLWRMEQGMEQCILCKLVFTKEAIVDWLDGILNDIDAFQRDGTKPDTLLDTEESSSESSPGSQGH